MRYDGADNQIGGSSPGHAIYVPPPTSLLPELLSSFEKHFHRNDDQPLLALRLTPIADHRL